MANAIPEIHLPAFNGQVLTGIAQGTDTGLKLNQRLVVRSSYRDYTPDKAACAMATEACRIDRTVLRAVPGGMVLPEDNTVTDLLVGMAYAGTHLGHLRIRHGQAPWDGTAGVATFSDIELRNDASEAVEAQDVAAATASLARIEGLGGIYATILFGTKIAWWSTNHHTGHTTEPARINPYLRKCLNMLPGMEANFQDRHLEAVWVAAHWFCAPTILHSCGIDGLLGGARVFANCARGGVLVQDDVRLRSDAPPAGIHKWSVSAAIWNMCKGMPQVAFMQNVDLVMRNSRDLAGMLQDCGDTFDNTIARYHIGSHHLTGRARRTIGWESGIGLTGALAWHCLPASTLTKSPHVSLNGHATYINDSTFDVSWDDFLREYVTASALNPGEAVKNLVAGQTKGMCSLQIFLTLAEDRHGAPLTQDEEDRAVAEYHALADKAAGRAANQGQGQGAGNAQLAALLQGIMNAQNQGAQNAPPPPPPPQGQQQPPAQPQGPPQGPAPGQQPPQGPGQPPGANPNP